MIPRVYIPQLLKVDQQVVLPKPTAHHICTVLRLKVGSEMVLFNGQGGEYLATLQTAGKTAEVMINKFNEQSVQSRLNIHLGQALSRGDRMDFTLQKATELGVQSITPLITERCLTKIKADKTDKKQQHWEQVIISAAEQSGRTDVPQLNAASPLSTWLAQPFSGTSLVMNPGKSAHTLSTLDMNSMTFRFLVGPESGLTSTELETAEQHGFLPFELGPRILRTETAAMAMIASLQAKFGDFC